VDESRKPTTKTGSEVKRAMGILIGGTLLLWLGAALPAGLLMDNGPDPVVTACAAGICLIPGILTALLIRQMRHRPAYDRLVAIFVSIFLRMGLTLGGGLGLYYLIPNIRSNAIPFISWGLAFYLITLAGETVILSASMVDPVTTRKDS
jgi:hypothetical protein